MSFSNSLYYKFGQTSTHKQRVLKLLVPLELPYIILSFLYIFLRFELLHQINGIFLFVLLFSSSWFIIGPRLVYNFMTLFLSLQTNKKICSELTQYFKINEKKHYKIYKICLIIEGTVISLAGIIPITLFPNILSQNITYGKTDLFFWLIIFFLIWFLFYCANATSFISLITFKIIPDIINDKIFMYDPMNLVHRNSLEVIRNLCNKAVAYTCSGLVFIPLAIYFILQQPRLVMDMQTSNFGIILSPLNQPIYLFWVIGLMFIYCTFLFLFITYPNYKLKKYVRQKSKEYLYWEEVKYIKNFSLIPSIRHSNFLSEQIYQYNIYLRLQETKNLCSTAFTFDSNIVVTYITIFVTLLSAVPGFIQLFA